MRHFVARFHIRLGFFLEGTSFLVSPSFSWNAKIDWFTLKINKKCEIIKSFKIHTVALSNDFDDLEDLEEELEVELERQRWTSDGNLSSSSDCLWNNGTFRDSSSSLPYSSSALLAAAPTLFLSWWTRTLTSSEGMTWSFSFACLIEAIWNKHLFLRDPMFFRTWP